MSENEPDRMSSQASTYVLEPLKLMYVGLPKVACTSTKWMIAELAGEDELSFRATIKSAPTRRQTIHWREAWEHAPRFADLESAARRRITPENGWFVWAMVRDPRARVWSAWQSKLLVRNPGYLRRYAKEPWFPRVPERPEHVIEDFATFVDAFARGQVGGLATDVHFGCQSDLLDAARVKHFAVYDLSQSDELRADLARHLAGFGRTVPEVAGHDNETPLRLTAEVLANGVRESIESIYARDFDRFGTLWSGPPRTSPISTWTPATLADVATRVSLHRRLADLRGVARRMAGRAAALEARPAT